MRGVPDWRASIALAPFAALAGSLFYFDAVDMLDLRPTLPELGGRLFGLALMGATSIALGRHWLSSDPIGRPAYVDDVVARARLKLRPGPSAAEWLGILRLAALVGAVAISFGLIFDPRYRDFPIEIYLVPAIGFAVEALRQPRWASAPGGPVETVLCWLVIGQGALVLGLEGVENLQAAAWAVTSALLGVRIIAARRQ
jgi:glucan 1,3-beta-glucosidase